MIFYPVSLTFEFELISNNFNISYNFNTRRDYAFLFRICIPCDKVFYMVPQFWRGCWGYDACVTLKFDLVHKK